MTYGFYGMKPISKKQGNNTMTELLTSFPIGFYVLIAVLALICEYIDSAMGGGYGTILVPVLFAFNVDRQLLIPAVLFTEMCCGFSSAILHHLAGNADFQIKIFNGKEAKQNGRIRLSPDFKISAILALCGIVGGVIAAYASLKINDLAMKTYIGVLVLFMGILVVSKMKWKFTWWKIYGIGLIAAFNKGLSGGGYGPLISSGQIIAERSPRQAVASTSLSEAVVCVVSLLVIVTIPAYQVIIFSLPFLHLILALFIGSMVSVPFAVLTVKHVPLKKMQPIIGIVTILLGVFTLVKAYVTF